MSAHAGWLVVLAILGIGGAIVGLTYFVYRGLREDHETGEYEFTWGVAVVVLFLMGFAPGLVGVGLYLVVERGYPAHWAWIAVVLAVVLLVAVASISLSVATVVETSETVAASR